MAITDLGLLGTGSSKTAATTLAVVNTTGAVIPAGTLVHVVGCWDNIASVTAPTITCSTIGGGTATANHAPAIGSGVTTTAGSGVWHTCFRALTTTTIASGATICTLTSNQSAVARAAHAEGWTGLTATLRGTVTTATSTTGAPSVATTGTALVAGDLVIGSVSFENSAQMTGDADTLNGTWDTIVGTFTTGGGAATNCGTGTQDKTVTATGAQTFNPTGGVADTVACVYSLVPVPDPLVTQAAYRFYADGTETGSTALAGQDTAPTVDVTGGDVNLGLRVRLQETAGGTSLPTTDDWRLQWEKNASGVWSDLGAADPVLTDSSEPAPFATFIGAPEVNNALGQSFLGNGQPLVAAAFLLKARGTPPGDSTATIYAHTGTFGSVSGIPTGSPLTTSTPVPVSVVPTTNTWVPFTFDGTFTPSNGTPYVIAVEYTGGSGSIDISAGYSNAATHGGNLAQRNTSTGVWTAGGSGAYDLAFRVYSGAGGSVVTSYNSASLTDAAATTSRLTGGTGTFVAGEVSEDGLADDVGWSASNFTELLYSVTLKQSALTDADALRFRVLRNGATTSVTYTSVPTLNVTLVSGPVTLNATAALTATSTLVAAAYEENLAAVTLATTSTLTAAAVRTQPATTTLTATSTLTATGTATAVIVQTAAATLTAASTLTVAGVREPQATASLTAGSTLTATAVRVQLATSALAASSTLTVTGVREPQAAVGLAAALTLTATATVAGAPVQQAATALAAASTLVVAAVREPQAAVSLVAGSTLTVAGVREQPATLALAGTSTLTATSVRAPQAAASLGVASSLTATALRAQNATSALTGASTLVATGVREPQAAASLTAGSTLAAAGVRTATLAATLTSTSTLVVTAVGVSTALGTAALAGTSTLTATAVRVPVASAALTGTSTLVAGADRTATVAAALAGTSTLTAASVRQPQGAASLVATSTLTAASVRTTTATAALTGVSTLTATAVGVGAAAGTAALVATSTLTATGVRVVPAALALTASSTLVAAAVRAPQAAASLTATSTLTVVGVRTRVATATLTGTATLTATAVGIGVAGATVTLTATSTLTAAGRQTQTARATLTATATLTVVGVRAGFGAAPLIATATLTVTAVRVVPGATALTTTATLTAVAVRTGLVGIPNAAHTGYIYALAPNHEWGLLTNPMPV